MKRLSTLLTILILQIIPLSAAFAESYEPSRMIHIVYDDSGSMIKDDDQVYVDTWCQAKYAMEVVAAMLGERDTLKVYYMSDFDNGRTGTPLEMQGSRDPAQVSRNVAQIHDKVTPFSNTPFAAVRKAGQDLKSSSADENWLIILTDGEFDNTAKKDVENYYYQVAADPRTRVITLTMGAHVTGIDADPERGVFYEHAATSDEIRGHLTRICNRIFQRNALPSVGENEQGISGNRVNFGVPMSQLIVFAQGSDVKIGNAKSADGTSFSATSNVHAAYSELAASNLPHPENVVVNKSLKGQIATFDGDFKPGKYTFDVTGADNIEVYYKPNVEVTMSLYDIVGTEVTKDEKLINGSYRIEFGFAGATDHVRVEDASLLGKVDYQGEIENELMSGKSEKQTVKSGDTVTLQEGTLNVDVTAHFLEYNTVNTKSSYKIFFANELVWTFDARPTYELVKDGFSNGSEPIVMTVKMKDNDALRALTSEEWAVMSVPKIKYLGLDTDKENETSLGDFKVEKSDAVGSFKIYPSISQDGPFRTTTGTLPIAISGGFAHGDSTAAGSTKDSIEIVDKITSWERFVDWLSRNWHWLWKAITGFFFILGYIPGVKKRMPKGMKKQPAIARKPQTIGLPKDPLSGSFKYKTITRIVPYVSEKGIFKFPSSMNIPVPKTLQLEAAGGSNIILVNKDQFAGKKEIEFAGKSGGDIVKSGKKKKPLKFNANLDIVIKTKDYKYSCTLTKDKV